MQVADPYIDPAFNFQSHTQVRKRSAKTPKRAKSGNKKRKPDESSTDSKSTIDVNNDARFWSIQHPENELNYGDIQYASQRQPDLRARKIKQHLGSPKGNQMLNKAPFV